MEEGVSITISKGRDFFGEEEGLQIFLLRLEFSALGDHKYIDFLVVFFIPFIMHVHTDLLYGVFPICSLYFLVTGVGIF